jgi:outer membrane murein-binding lipoprotein Lpp
MNLSDGAIMFIACVVSFVLGYIVGVVRVSRYVNARLDEIKTSVQTVQKQAAQLQQIYAKIGEEK